MDAKTELDRLLETRRSVRRFKPEAPPRELVDAVVRAGLLAPTGRRRQWTYVIRLDDPQIREEVRSANAEIMGAPPAGRPADPFYAAPVMLLVISKKSDTDIHDGSLALGYMMLKAHELGLASCWIHRAAPEMEMPVGRKILDRLGLEGEYVGVGHLALGYADGPQPPAYEINPGRYLSV